jgi:hypothetical protein
MSLLDPNWKYTHSTATDIRKTFKKARTAIAKNRQPAARLPKLQLMSAPADAANSANLGARSISSQHGGRSVGADGLPANENHDYPALIIARSNQRVGA